MNTEIFAHLFTDAAQTSRTQVNKFLLNAQNGCEKDGEEKTNTTWWYQYSIKEKALDLR